MTETLTRPEASGHSRDRPDFEESRIKESHVGSRSTMGARGPVGGRDFVGAGIMWGKRYCGGRGPVG